MKLLIDNQTSKYGDYQSFFESVLYETINHLAIGSAVEVSLVLTNNDGIRILNREYRGIDKLTDVLSFPMYDLNPYDKDKKTWLAELEYNRKITCGAEDLPIGDIVISVEKAEEQAREFGHSLRRELAFLMIHGILHLLGYDHEIGQAEENEMEALQEEILQKLNLPRV
ncbi:MAG: rRNA maturation RNase YbeY [Caldicoprobacterales bacterium]|jgi:probable rRNA maturation factor|nr:rRNA maturation RNase YbeY [Clostridiales bacterium]